MTVAVFGSINMDITAYMERLPKPGEILHGLRYKLGLGGKGANQAVAARKLGSDVGSPIPFLSTAPGPAESLPNGLSSQRKWP